MQYCYYIYTSPNKIIFCLHRACPSTIAEQTPPIRNRAFWRRCTVDSTISTRSIFRFKGKQPHSFDIDPFARQPRHPKNKTTIPCKCSYVKISRNSSALRQRWTAFAKSSSTNTSRNRWDTSRYWTSTTTRRKDCPPSTPKSEKSSRNQPPKAYTKTYSLPWSATAITSKGGNQNREKATLPPSTRTWQ